MIDYARREAANRRLGQLGEQFAVEMERQRTLGATHRDTLQSMHSLATAYAKSGSLDKAVSLQEETLALQKTALGPKDRHTLRSMNSLAVWYARLGRTEEAIAIW